MHDETAGDPCGDRVVACMDPTTLATQVLETAARLASERHAIWYAVYVTRCGSSTHEPARSGPLAANGPAR